MDIMTKIRGRAKSEEVDYLFIMECLSMYRQPRAKLTSLLKDQQLIRVKKGLYVFGKEYQQRPYSLEVLANLIYGPSYISFEYALAYYNLIPETVTRVTSACSKRIKHFTTPVGEFVYYYVPPEKFSSGISWQSVDENTHFLIATKEKALADYVARIKPFGNKKDLLLYLVEGMRIDSDELFNFNTSLMDEISHYYKNRNVTFLCSILKK